MQLLSSVLIRSIPCWCFGLMLCFLVFCSSSPQRPKPELKAGVSVASINPSIGAFIAGDDQNRTFTGIHDSLYAKAIVLSAGESQVAIVTLDCIGLLYPEVCRIREKTAALCGFPKERIVVSSTHTHAGPDVVGIWGQDYQHSGVDSVYLNFLVNTAARQIQKALQNQQIATASVSISTFGEPWVQNICQEEIDRTLSVLQFKNSSGKSIATLVNFACHPTFMDAITSEVSADYVHGYYQTLKQATGGEALFLQGAIGGWVQPEDGEGSFDKAFQRGSELANATLKAMTQARLLKSNDIQFRNKEVRFPVENEGWKQLSAIGTIKRPIQDSVSTELSWFSLGEVHFVTHPGETAPFYALETKKLIGSQPTFILGLGNDALGYIVKPSFFENKSLPHAEYLTSMSVGKPTGPLMMQYLKALIPADAMK